MRAALWCLAALALPATAQVLAPVRVTSFDWQCQDKDGGKLSDHQRFDTTYTACINNPAGALIVGGTYRIQRPEPPPPPGPKPLTAPTLSAERVAGTNAGRSNVRLSWGAVERATGYEVQRCTGLACTDFASLDATSSAAYINSNLPDGIAFRYRARAIAGSEQGPYSEPLTAAVFTPQAPAGQAVLSWSVPAKNTDGSPLTDLSGYLIVYGRQADALTESKQIAAPASSHTLTGLDPGTWYFGVRAVNAAGAQSDLSNIASKAL